MYAPGRRSDSGQRLGRGARRQVVAACHQRGGVRVLQRDPDFRRRGARDIEPGDQQVPSSGAVSGVLSA
jgi:hypothetical protein